MDATTLLPTPRKVLRTLRWSFDVLLWTEDTTRRWVCSFMAPFTGQTAQRTAAPAAPPSNGPSGGGTAATRVATPASEERSPAARPATYGPPAAEVGEVAPEAAVAEAPADSAPAGGAATEAFADERADERRAAEGRAGEGAGNEVDTANEASDDAGATEAAAPAGPTGWVVTEEPSEASEADGGEPLVVEDGATLLAEGVLPEGVLAAPGVARSDEASADDGSDAVTVTEGPSTVGAGAAAAGAEDGEEEADDLTVINGIGPRIAERLTHHGITTFAQLAAWTDEEVTRFEDQLPGVQRGKARRDRWVEQARELLERSQASEGDGEGEGAGAAGHASPTDTGDEPGQGDGADTISRHASDLP